MKSILAAFLSLCLSGCTFLRSAEKAIRLCAGQEVAKASWDDARSLADAALHAEWSSAQAILASLAVKYGSDFVDCVVADLSADYARVERSTGPLLGAAVKTQSLANAQRWLAREVR